MDWRTTDPPAGDRIVGIDFETTGLDPIIGRVISVGVAAITRHGQIVRCEQMLVNPGVPVPLEATRVNRITDEALVGAAQWNEASSLLCERTEGALVVAHRLPFEAAFWASEDARAGLVSPARAGMCTKVLAGVAGLRGQLSGLREACASLGLDVGAALGQRGGMPSRGRWHEAGWDAAAVAVLAAALLSETGPLDGPMQARAQHDRWLAGGRRSLNRVMAPLRWEIETYRAALRDGPPHASGAGISR